MSSKTIQMKLLVLAVLFVAGMDHVICSSNCNQAVLRLYGWCEQWDCTDNCTCSVHRDCRQYCDAQTCRDMRCLSPSICKQTVHMTGATQPHVLNMFARAPFVTQDCSGGKCDVIRAKGHWRRLNGPKKGKSATRKQRGKDSSETVTRFKETTSAALQNCIGGVCQRLISTLQISKQFCTDCAKMHCMGQHATNCTQVCAKGRCRQMVCDAKDCQQACLQNSTCSLKCGSDVKVCLQICEKGSDCSMACDAQNCKQICGDGNNCHRIQKGKTLTNDIKPTADSVTSLTPSIVYNFTQGYNISTLQDIFSTTAASPTQYIDLYTTNTPDRSETDNNSVEGLEVRVKGQTQGKGRSTVLRSNLLSWLLSVSLAFVFAAHSSC